ncbi:MAG TPA: hypothetical protein VG982_00310 [Candidatus Paceibacterota bacterium]|nr:hypothetical protein [Candidatus Paceibacterota bacterium]
MKQQTSQWIKDGAYRTIILFILGMACFWFTFFYIAYILGAYNKNVSSGLTIAVTLFSLFLSVYIPYKLLGVIFYGKRAKRRVEQSEKWQKRYLQGVIEEESNFAATMNDRISKIRDETEKFIEGMRSNTEDKVENIKKKYEEMHSHANEAKRLLAK